MPFQQNSRLASRRTGLKVSGTVIVMLGVLAGGLAQAAEWSRARILSGVGQPLSVEIPVRDLPAGLLPASISATVDAGHATDAGLADRQAMPVSATLLPRADGADGAILVLTSSQAVPRGVVDLALQLDLPSGTERRRIVLLLAPAKGANITPVRLASTEPAGSIRVARGDTLGAIAAQLRRQAGTDSGTLEQWLAALFETNPAAFIQGNLHLVRAGATLAVPSIDAVRAIDPATARRLVAAHLRDFTALRGKVARPAPMAAVPAPATEPAASRGAVAIPAPAPAPAQNRDSLRLSSLLPGNGTAHAATRDSQAVIDQLRDERAATQKALEDARSRVGELESTVQEMEKLLGLQNEALARLQRQGSSSPRSAGSAIAPGTANGAGRDAPAAAAGVADRLADGAIGSAEGLNGTGGAVAAAPDAGMAGRAASGAAASSAGATGAGRTPATDSATTAGAPPPAMAQSLQPDNAQPANGGATPAAAAVPSVGGNAAASGAMASSPAGAGVLGSSTDTATSASAGSRAAVTPASAGSAPVDAGVTAPAAGTATPADTEAAASVPRASAQGRPGETASVQNRANETASASVQDRANAVASASVRGRANETATSRPGENASIQGQTDEIASASAQDRPGEHASAVGGAAIANDAARAAITNETVTNETATNETAAGAGQASTAEVARAMAASVPGATSAISGAAPAPRATDTAAAVTSTSTAKGPTGSIGTETPAASLPDPSGSLPALAGAPAARPQDAAPGQTPAAEASTTNRVSSQSPAAGASTANGASGLSPADAASTANGASDQSLAETANAANGAGGSNTPAAAMQGAAGPQSAASAASAPDANRARSGGSASATPPAASPPAATPPATAAADSDSFTAWGLGALIVFALAVVAYLIRRKPESVVLDDDGPDTAPLSPPPPLKVDFDLDLESPPSNGQDRKDGGSSSPSNGPDRGEDSSPPRQP